MSTVSSHARVEFTPRSGESWRDPWPMYEQLREHDPVHRVVPRDAPDCDFYVLSRHRHILDAVRDHETWSSGDGLTTEYGELERIGLADNPPMVMTDPPSHTDFRRLVSRGFTPRQVESVEPAVHRFVTERLDALLADGGGDIVAELFKPLPSMVVAHYLGVPEADRSRFDAWTDAIVAGSARGQDEVAAATMEMDEYFAGLISWRRRDPEDDTVSHLVAAGEADDDAGLLRILAFTFTMVSGGNDTTTGLLGGAVQLLTQRPDQRELLVREPGLIPDAVEEFLRLTSPVQGLCRTPTRDVVVDGVTVPRGRKTLMLYAAGNRDPRAYGPDADELDVRRQPRQILSFSHGAHHCLGAAAARMQARVALTELLRRCPDFTVDVDAVRWASGAYVRRPTSLPFAVVR